MYWAIGCISNPFVSKFNVRPILFAMIYMLCPIEKPGVFLQNDDFIIPVIQKTVNITTFKKSCITVLVLDVLIFTKQGWQKSNR